MMKKALSALLAFLLALSLLPASALAEDAPASPAFEDVDPGAWYYGAVQSASQNGLMEGVGGRCFAPDAVVTRAMLCAVLHRLDGSAEAGAAGSFSDVPSDAWYSGAVQWAAANGITTGRGDGTFGPSDGATRQQMAAMFQRFAQVKGRQAESAADLSAYADVSEVATWARGAMGWAVATGLITGADGALAPGGAATRAQLAALLMRYRNGAALESRTAEYISQFMKLDFGTFYADCSETLRQGIPQEALLQGWGLVLQAAGVMGESLGCVYTKQNGYDVVVSTIEGTLNNIRVTVTFGSDGKPVGLWTTIAPKDPPAPQTAEKWEEFPVTVGEPGLPGMLTLPKGAAAPPVVILVQGSGASDMNETLGTAPNRPFEDLAHGLAEMGVATLRYNKRTYQYPAADATIEYEILSDAAAAVKLLCADGRVDAARIYLLGHSLGGMMAPKIAADNPEIKGFISLAGSLRPLQEIILDQNIAAIRAETSLTEQQKDDLIAQATAEAGKVKTLDDGGTGAILGVPTNYWRSLNAIDGLSTVENLTVPMLILQGSADFQVYPDKDYQLWQTTLAGRGNVTCKLYDGLSHLFMPNQISAGGAPDISVYNQPNHVEPEVIADIAAWVNSR